MHFINSGVRASCIHCSLIALRPKAFCSNDVYGELFCSCTVSIQATITFARLTFFSTILYLNALKITFYSIDFVIKEFCSIYLGVQFLKQKVIKSHQSVNILEKKSF